MAQFKVLVRSFIDNQSYEAGSVIEYDGIPADNLAPIDKDAKAAVAAAAAAGIPTAVPADWNPPLGIADAASALAGTSAAQNPAALAAAAQIITGDGSVSGAPAPAAQ